MKSRLMYKVNSILLSTLIFLLFSFFHENTLSQIKSSDDTVVGKIGKEKLYLGELINYYQKNSAENDISVNTLREFLPKYVVYKLKLKEGLNQNLDQNHEILCELQNYSTQAAYNFWWEQEVKKHLFDEFKARSKFEIKSFHLLQRIGKSASPADTLHAYKKLQKARSEFLRGTSIEELDRRYSTQLQHQSAGGQLPWMSAGTTVKPFEDGMYSTEPGSISEPVRTQFGYHLIYVQDKRKKTKDRKVSHIFFRETDSEAPQTKADNIWNMLNNGADWDSLTVSNSEDGSSRNKSGDIGWIGYGMQFAENFIDAVMEIDLHIPFSRPVKTDYGIHILKIDSVRTYQSESRRDKELRKKLEKLSQFKNKKKIVLQKIAKIGNSITYDDNLTSFENFIESQDSVDIESLNPAQLLSDSSLFSFYGKNYSGSDYLTWLKNNYSQADANRYNNMWFNLFQDSIYESVMIETTKNRFPEFKDQIQLFRNDLIVYKISEENVWSTSSSDSTVLLDIFTENREKYRFNKRYVYSIIAAKSDSLLLTSKTQIAVRGMHIDSLQSKFPDVTVYSDSTDYITAHPFSMLPEMKRGQISDIFKYRDRKAIIYLSQILPSRKMNFEEAYYKVLNDYQPKREKEYLSYLREKYKSKIFSEKIK